MRRAIGSYDHRSLPDYRLDPPDEPDPAACPECGHEGATVVDRRERSEECAECGYCFYAYDWDSHPGGADYED